MLIFMSSFGVEARKEFDISAHSAAYNTWREINILTPSAIEYRCCHLSDNDLGGAYVDNDYCKSFCNGKGCSELKTCKQRLNHLKLRGVKNTTNR